MPYGLHISILHLVELHQQSDVVNSTKRLGFAALPDTTQNQ